jgi:hypothetical protein
VADDKARLILAAVDETAGVFSAVRGRLGVLQSSAQSLTGELGSMATGIAGLFAAGGLGAVFKQTVDGLDALNDLADATGSSIEKLSSLESVALQTGTSLDVAGTAVVKLNQLLNAASPDSNQAKALKAIGLSVEELKALDPADALERVAKALAGYADDGNKARLVQELLGKSASESWRRCSRIWPNVASVLRRSPSSRPRKPRSSTCSSLRCRPMPPAPLATLAGPFIKAINDVVTEARIGTQVFGSFWAAVANVNPLTSFAKAEQGVEAYRKKVIDLVALRNMLEVNPNPVAKRASLAAVDADIAKAQKLEEFYRALFKAQAPDLGQTDPRELARRRRPTGVLPTVPTLPDPPKPTKAAKVKAAADPRDFIGPEVPQALKDARAAIDATDVAKAQRLRDTLNSLLVLDQAPSTVEAIADITEQLQRLDPALVAAEKARQRLDDLVGRSGAPAQQLQDLAALDDAYFAGTISLAEYEAGLGKVFRGLNDLPKATTEAEKAVSTFADQAQRNVQDLVANGIGKLFKGEFDSVGDAIRQVGRLWLTTLIDMQAQAAALKLNEYLFGSKGGSGGGSSAGALTSAFAAIFGGFREGGGPVSPGRAYVVGERRPELFVPDSAGTIMPGVGQGGITVVQHVTIGAGVNRSEVMQAMEAAKRGAIAAIQDMAMRGRPAF